MEVKATEDHRYVHLGAVQSPRALIERLETSKFSHLVLFVPCCGRALNGYFVSDMYALERNIVFGCGASRGQSLEWVAGIVRTGEMLLP